MMDNCGNSFGWRYSGNKEQKGYAAWSPFEKDTEYFSDAAQQYMIKYRVGDLDALIKKLKEEGVMIVDQMGIYEYGKFVHIPNGKETGLSYGRPTTIGMAKCSRRLPNNGMTGGSID